MQQLKYCNVAKTPRIANNRVKHSIREGNSTLNIISRLD